MTLRIPQTRRSGSPWRRPGPWLALVAALYLLVAAGRAVLDPAGFASSIGLPLSDPSDDGFVLVYASRTVVLAVLTLLLLAMRQWRTLSLLAAVAVVAPLTDAWLTSDAGADRATVARHLVVAAFVALTSVTTWRVATTSEEPTEA